jgi:hypothetical protein
MTARLQQSCIEPFTTFFGEIPMMFLNSLNSRLRKRTPAVKTPKPPSARLRLEELEDRYVPSFTTNVYVNPTVQIIPGSIVTETVTATVTNFPGFNMRTGQITPVPAGASNPTSGIVLFTLNNQVKSATLNANGQASATFQVPILAFLASQNLDVYYNGSADLANNDFWMQSTSRTWLYTNFDNLILPGTLTFAQLTPEQVHAFEINLFQNRNPNAPPGGEDPQSLPTILRPDLTANGETDTLGNGLIAFNYGDPGTIQSVVALGISLPPSFAFQLGAYKGLQ